MPLTPIERRHYLLGYWLGLLAVLAVFALLCALIPGLFEEWAGLN